jgi:hypothetical protein
MKTADKSTSKRELKTRLPRKEAYGMTQNKMVARSPERQREKREELAEVERRERKYLDGRGWRKNGETTGGVSLC